MSIENNQVFTIVNDEKKQQIDESHIEMTTESIKDDKVAISNKTKWTKFKILTERIIIDSCLPINNPLSNQFLLFVLLSGLSWLVLFLVNEKNAKPGGICFSLLVEFISAHIFGILFEKCKLPSLLGMLVSGIIFKNVPVINIIGQSIDSQTSSILRNISFCVILCKAGLSLDVISLRKIKFQILRFAFLPNIAEAFIFAIISHFVLNIPLIWAALAGFVVCGVSPAVVVPMMIDLNERSLGKLNEFQCLVIASSCVDNIIAITGHSILISIIFNSSSLWWTIVRCPIEIIIGISYGLIVGVFLTVIRHTFMMKLPSLRFIVLILFAVIGLLGSKKISFPSAGPISVLILTITVKKIWEMVDVNMLSEHSRNESETIQLISKLWTYFCLPLLFFLIGNEIEFKKISLDFIGICLGLIAIALVARIIATFFSVSCNKFSLKEKLFLCLMWIPKATVQAAVGSIALDFARETSNTEQIDVATKVLSIAVISIISTAPIGCLLIGLIVPRLLKI